MDRKREKERVREEEKGRERKCEYGRQKKNREQKVSLMRRCLQRVEIMMCQYLKQLQSYAYTVYHKLLVYKNMFCIFSLKNRAKKSTKQQSYFFL